MTTNLGVGYVSAFTVMDLRNGALEDITAIVPSTAIPTQYHWNVIASVPDNRLLAYTEMNMRLQYAVLTAAEADATVDRRRSQAIIMGAMRTGLRAFWKIIVADLSPGETSRAYVTYRAATDGNAEGVTATWGTATATAATAAWAAWTDLTPLEKEVSEAFILLSIAVLPTVGWSLVKTGHHYLSQAGPAPRAGYAAIKKQWFTKVSAGVSAWVKSREEYWEDIAFHKVCHPILMSVAISIASSPSTKGKLEQADWGAAAVRLPATTPKLEYAKMVVALLTKVSGVLAVSNSTVDTTRLTAAITLAQTSTDLAARTAAVNTADALAHAKDALIAIAAGILIHITESGAPSSIASSFGFKRLVGEYPAEVAKGTTLSRALAARERDAIRDGANVPLDITF